MNSIRFTKLLFILLCVSCCLQNCNPYQIVQVFNDNNIQENDWNCTKIKVNLETSDIYEGMLPQKLYKKNGSKMVCTLGTKTNGKHTITHN